MSSSIESTSPLHPAQLEELPQLAVDHPALA
jgi:hypothetical protein